MSLVFDLTIDMKSLTEYVYASDELDDEVYTIIRYLIGHAYELPIPWYVANGVLYRYSEAIYIPTRTCVFFKGRPYDVSHLTPLRAHDVIQLIVHPCTDGLRDRLKNAEDRLNVLRWSLDLDPLRPYLSSGNEAVDEKNMRRLITSYEVTYDTLRTYLSKM